MFSAPIKDPISKAPDLEGPYAKAWKVDLPEALRLAGIKPEDDAGLVHWIVEAPWAHLAWHSYSIVLVHLRPMPDKRPTNIYLKDATHEMWIWAISPDAVREEMLRTGHPQWLTPQNFAAQFIAATDADALNRVQKSVEMISRGQISPDTDFRRAWEILFGDNMVKK